jgi:F0F1-type ATP synthase membrane subunit b/b'
MKLTKYIIYLVILAIHLVIALFTGNSPNDSLNGFLSYMFLGMWICISMGYLSKMKRIREYSASMNNFGLIFGGLGVGIFYAIWGDYTTILSANVFSLNVSFNPWIIILALPYLFYSMLLLSLCFSKYFHIYFGNKSIGARTFSLFTGIVFLFIDAVYLLMSQDIISIPIWGLDPETSAINLIILLNAIVLLIYLIISITKRRPAISGISMNRVSNRLNDIDRQIENADRFTSAARRGELNSQVQASQDRESRRRQKEQEKERERRRKREERERKKRQGQQRARQSKPKTRTSASRSRRSPSASTSSSSSSTSAKKKELLRMRPKTGMLCQDDFKCIFCFELPSTSDGHHGIILCPNCRYPAHADEFQSWVRTSNLCSRCDGTIPSRFRRHPTIIPVKEYLRAYKFWKKKF